MHSAPVLGARFTSIRFERPPGSLMLPPFSRIALSGRSVHGRSHDLQ